jgi:uncharacterized protein YnzC (UPF0291/DUF896 family)
MGKVKEQEPNIMEIPTPFMTEKEIKEYNLLKKSIIENRTKKVKDAIYNLKYYSDRYNVLDLHLPEKEKQQSWHFNNSLESIKEAAKSLLENLELLNNKNEQDVK